MGANRKVWGRRLLFQPSDERACLLTRQVEIIDTEEQQEPVARTFDAMVVIVVTGIWISFEAAIFDSVVFFFCCCSSLLRNKSASVSRPCVRCMSDAQRRSESRR